MLTHAIYGFVGFHTHTFHTKGLSSTQNHTSYGSTISPSSILPA